MPFDLPYPPDDVSHILYSCTGKADFIEDNEILSITCLLEKPHSASNLQQIMANHSLVRVNP